MGKEGASRKTKKIHQNLNPTSLTQREKKEKEAASRKRNRIRQGKNPTALNQSQ